MTKERQDFGNRGENLAARFLETKGFRILARNWRSRVGEIDVIAKRGDEVRFVEVKTRTSLLYGFPEEAVTKKKRQHLYRTIECWLRTQKALPRHYQADVIAIVARPGLPPDIEWIEGIEENGQYV